MGIDGSSAVPGIERPPGESLYQKLVAEGRIAKEVIAERRRQYAEDGKDPAEADCGLAEAFFIRVEREREDEGAGR
jgi:hypothetical protein